MKESPNLKYIDQLAGGDNEFREKFIGILKEEFPLESEEYQKNMEGRLFKVASENVHKIKHKINVLGLHNTYTLAVRHENELRNGEDTLHGEFMGILQDIQSYLKTI
ncbi:Hpt domain-containing protein [Flagellimonas nanhaiensis]|uniref:Hpt domain-containing protein n=1 Tax=Flagellimonas nanhaiensis TaxID=2292706 RepID=A0A371JMR6_9FLAO|nr:Hpt domain-containing protein [Allomuricauda nanhaiensis]RDY58426.1 Hpt domain-containing protein [Allomuricauda nanhaiensis]